MSLAGFMDLLIFFFNFSHSDHNRLRSYFLVVNYVGQGFLMNNIKNCISEQDSSVNLRELKFLDAHNLQTL